MSRLGMAYLSFRQRSSELDSLSVRVAYLELDQVAPQQCAKHKSIATRRKGRKWVSQNVESIRRIQNATIWALMRVIGYCGSLWTAVLKSSL